MEQNPSFAFVSIDTILKNEKVVQYPVQNFTFMFLIFYIVGVIYILFIFY